MNKNTLASSYRFVKQKDDVSAFINKKANELFWQLKQADIQQIGLDDFGKHYFSNHHTGRRLHFSMESSAAILYHAIKKINKNIHDIVLVDYGAGLGTLFLLAGTLGFKKVIYNDHLASWNTNAQLLSKYLGVPITDYVTGDVDELITYGKKNDTLFDIIASRNVIEHIYDLRAFYSKISQSKIATICYATTTANYHNLAMRLIHHLYHKKAERKFYKQQRKEYIRELLPKIDEKDLMRLIHLTRGRAFYDFTHAVELFINKRNIPPVEFLSTNTCDCKTGVWAEHIIPKAAYADIIQTADFSMEYLPGFWDVHYKYMLVNMITRMLNKIIGLLKNKGYWLSPFVNVIATRNNNE